MPDPFTGHGFAAWCLLWLGLIIGFANLVGWLNSLVL